MRMVGRITNRNHGLKEADVIRLIQALITSRITYSAPYLNLNQGEKNRINILIRKAFKIALGLPLYAATDKLLAMGVHNTFQELIQAHLASQQERLALTPTGRTVLQNLHFPIPSTVRDTAPYQRSYGTTFKWPRSPRICIPSFTPVGALPELGPSSAHMAARPTPGSLTLPCTRMNQRPQSA
ncbi:unnamed protein product [Ixodes hexagonus]